MTEALSPRLSARAVERRTAGAVAVVVWLVVGAAAAVAPPLLRLNPFAATGQILPPLLAAVGLAVLVAAAYRVRKPWLYGAVVGLLTAFVVLVLRTALYGTPNALGAANKSYQVLALAITVPWVLATFARPPRGRLHWVPAGLIGGALLLNYYAYLLFCGAGLAGLVVAAAWRSPDRAAYVRHVAATTGVAFAVSATVPFLRASPLAAMQLLGLAGLVRYARTSWWAGPLLALLGSWAAATPTSPPT